MISIRLNKDDTRKALRSLTKELTSKKGRFQKSLASGARELNKRAARRYKKEFPRSQGRNGPDVRRAILASGFEIVQDASGDISIFMFDEDFLDKFTELPRTKSTRIVYHLWRLLSGGYGRLGSGDVTRGFKGLVRSDDYPLFVIVQDSSIDDIGVKPPFPELLRLENRGVVVVRSSGFAGREWFLKNGEMFKEDRTLMEETIDKAFNFAILRAGFRRT